MTIGKKLYVNFGSVLAMVVVLFLVNLAAVHREHAAKAAPPPRWNGRCNRQDQVPDDAKPAVPQQLSLSGDTREVEHMNEGHPLSRRRLSARLTLILTESENSSATPSEVQETETRLAPGFRHASGRKAEGSRSGNATVAELQIFYLQKDARSR